jgi:hypothetical protein
LTIYQAPYLLGEVSNRPLDAFPQCVGQMPMSLQDICPIYRSRFVG